MKGVFENTFFVSNLFDKMNCLLRISSLKYDDIIEKNASIVVQ